jgi:hypothetical protein
VELEVVAPWYSMYLVRHGPGLNSQHQTKAETETPMVDIFIRDKHRDTEEAHVKA